MRVSLNNDAHGAKKAAETGVPCTEGFSVLLSWRMWGSECASRSLAGSIMAHEKQERTSGIQGPKVDVEGKEKGK